MYVCVYVPLSVWYGTVWLTGLGWPCGVTQHCVQCRAVWWLVLLTVSGGAHAAEAVALGEQAGQRFVTGAFTQAAPAGLANQNRVGAGLREDDIWGRGEKKDFKLTS